MIKCILLHQENEEKEDKESEIENTVVKCDQLDNIDNEEIEDRESKMENTEVKCDQIDNIDDEELLTDIKFPEDVSPDSPLMVGVIFIL